MNPKEWLLAATLSRQCHMYNLKLFELAKVYGSLEELYMLWKKKKLNLAVLTELLNTAWSDEQLRLVEDVAHEHAIQPILYTDKDYPPLLHEIIDMPYVLYIKGDVSVLTAKKTVSCVGTRAISLYGKRVITHIIPPLGDYPVCVISGLALGVDGEVHRAALGNNIATAAVLAAGLDRYEPLSHHVLGEAIEKTGCMVSEYPPGVRPQKSQFLERNRIIAALSYVTIVIEGKPSSGSLVTARFAAAYGREVGVVPGSLFDQGSQGPHFLLKEGAWLVDSAQDIILLLGLEHTVPESKVDLGAVYNELLQEPKSLDSLQATLNLPLAEVQQELTLLEINGNVKVTDTGLYYALRIT